MKTLVAAPSCRKKAYSLPLWAAATSSYPRVIATEEEDFVADCRELGLEAITYDDPGPASGRHEICGPRFNAAWTAIVAYAEEHGFTHILSLESDVIPEGDIVPVMEKHYGEGFLCHLYPWPPQYNRPHSKAAEMGCTMGTTQVFRRALERCQKTGQQLYRAVRDMQHTDIDIMELQHLGA